MSRKKVKNGGLFPTNDKEKKSFLKWAGGKRRVMPYLLKYFPHDGKRYIEPFMGSAVVALNVDYSVRIINDYNKDLYSCFHYLQVMGMDFVAMCKKMFTQKNSTEKAYYKFRDEFNATDDQLRRAVLFVYMNRHGFNGLCRYNSQGGFNNPAGKHQNIYFPEQEFVDIIEELKTIQIMNSDFRDVFSDVRSGDVVYCDPPYVPVSVTANFKEYAMDGFGLQDQIDLAQCADTAAANGATVIISNHYNWYTQEIYTQMFNGKITKLNVSRTISSKADERKSVQEVIAVFSPKKGSRKVK